MGVANVQFKRSELNIYCSEFGTIGKSCENENQNVEKGGLGLRGGSRHEGFGVFEVILLEPVISKFETLPQFFSTKYPRLVYRRPEPSAQQSVSSHGFSQEAQVINASLRWNASVRRPEPSHRHSMLAPMVSVPPD